MLVNKTILAERFMICQLFILRGHMRRQDCKQALSSFSIQPGADYGEDKKTFSGRRTIGDRRVVR